MSTFKTMINNATSDYEHGYSFDVFKRQTDRANEWLSKRMEYLDNIKDKITNDKPDAIWFLNSSKYNGNTTEMWRCGAVCAVKT